MARYRCDNPEDWLPAWAKGKGLSVSVIRLKPVDGSVVEVTLDVNDETGEIGDPRCIRHLDADPRFTKL